jgi:hypothetical protein
VQAKRKKLIVKLAKFRTIECRLRLCTGGVTLPAADTIDELKKLPVTLLTLSALPSFCLRISLYSQTAFRARVAASALTVFR